jgi:hypothetical protein
MPKQKAQILLTSFEGDLATFYEENDLEEEESLMKSQVRRESSKENRETSQNTFQVGTVAKSLGIGIAVLMGLTIFTYQSTLACVN